jgi:cell division protein FtsI/penicillin-binding protein 2
VSEIRDGEGDQVSKHDPTQWKRATSPQTAQTMMEGMREVVRTGSATRIAVPGLDIGAKTGTAQFGPSEPLRSHAWIIAWAAPALGQAPTIAVAVIVENQDGASESTGGRLAAPIAKQVIEQSFQPMPAPPADPDDTTGSTTSTTAAN